MRSSDAAAESRPRFCPSARRARVCRGTSAGNSKRPHIDRLEATSCASARVKPYFRVRTLIVPVTAWLLMTGTEWRMLIARRALRTSDPSAQITIFVSAKTAVIQLVALDRHRFDPTAILGERGERGLTPSLAIGRPLGLEARQVVEHLPGFGLGEAADLNARGRAHGKAP